ncbi:hypothetical protein [Cephaloticoccus primus]|uniref:hypothetical protein n=1 Tax=Cephaloticoccus primus TaxID=1548207 RepID=UPI001E299DF9|nr:hypothetical protein [Cephaloticoccus primus]
MPDTLIAELRFVGRDAGAVKALSGFRKKQHTLPTAANPTTQAFLARLCAPELAERAEALFQTLREALGYKRRDISLNVESAQALLRARDFTLEIAYELDPASPSDYLITQTLLDAHEAAVLASDAFNAVFRGAFSELSFALKRGVQVEAVIDAVEALDDADGGNSGGPGGRGGDRAAPLRVSYPSDYSYCEIAVEGVAARVRCTGASVDLLFPKGGSPLELLREFAAVRAAFQLSKELGALLA